MTAFTLSFDDIGSADLPRVGGKGANLGELTRAGFKVPPGFCVSTDAFKQFMAGAKQDVYAPLDEVKADDLEQLREVGKEIRTSLSELPLPREVEEAVVAAWLELGDQHAYAVRSSATAEDLPHASFAGQQDTYLNVRGKDAVLGRVKDCFISLFTDRAILYRVQNGFDHRQVALAVVVQRMVQPEVAGILFTADPVTGNRNILSIDASFGLGEALVSGLVSADLYRVNKVSQSITERRIADKQMAIRSRATGGTEHVELSEGERTQAALSDAQVLELAEVGRRIEAHYGAPQDIEWALVEGAFYITQSRPITSLYPLPEPRPRDDALHLYISFGHAQVMTDPISELGRSLWRILAPFGRPEGALENPYLCSAGGRLYFDLSPMLRHPVMKRLVPRFLQIADPLIAAALNGVRRRETFLRRGGWVSWRDLRRWLAPVLLGGQRQLWFGTPEGVVEGLNRDTAAYIQQAATQLAAVPAGVGRLQVAQRLAATVFEEQAIRFPQYIAAGIFSQLLLRRLMPGTAHADDLNAIPRGLVGNVTTEMDLAVGDLADVARRSPDLVRHLSRTDVDAETLLATATSQPGGEAFMDAWRAFIARYGMRGPSEIDIARPRWREDPSSLLRMVVGNLQHEDHGVHRAHHARLIEEGNSAAQRIRNAARQGGWDWLKGPLVKRLTRVARTLPALREHPKFLLIRLMDLIKQVIIEAAEELVTRGQLEHISDVWFLSWPELARLLEDSEANVRQVVARRRQDLKHFASLTPPRVITSDGETPAAQHAVTDAPDGALIGNPVSAGVVEGVAKVVRDPQTETLKPGEILVAPFTDPGWTPLFIQAAGLVMEVGGLMTHGSVVAREYGIPAVVGVLDATTKIRTGQRLRVHGDAGYVELLDDTDEAARGAQKVSV